MFNKGLLKRVLPFLATFAFGIFVASFFVSIGASHSGNYQRGKCRSEVQRLREENLRLHYQLDSIHQEQTNLPHFESENWDVPNVEEPVLPPPPPLPVREHRPKAR